MRRPALSAARGIEVIDFLGSFPEGAFTLSQIARAIGVNVASCHAVLSELTERGYLSRSESGKTYSLGPALVAIGHAALRNQPLIARAEAAAEVLAREHKLPVSLTRAVNEEVIGIYATPGPKGMPNALPGFRLPLVPPVGAAFLAWSSDEAIDEWIGRRPDQPDAAREAGWRKALETIRERGFEVLLHSPESGHFPQVLSELASGQTLRDYKRQIFEFYGTTDQALHQPEVIDPEALYEVTLIAAPIFSNRGDAIYSLNFGPIPDKITGGQILVLADSLLGACLRIMREGRSV